MNKPAIIDRLSRPISLTLSLKGLQIGRGPRETDEMAVVEMYGRRETDIDSKGDGPFPHRRSLVWLSGFARWVFRRQRTDFLQDNTACGGDNSQRTHWIPGNASQSTGAGIIPEVPVIPASQGRTLDAIKQQETDELHSKIRSGLGLTNGELPDVGRESLSSIFKKKPVRDPSARDLIKTHGSVDARQLLNELSDLVDYVQALKFNASDTR